jgi:hypothetical protein
MAAVPYPERAICWILNNPELAIPNGHVDTVRAEIATQLAAYGAVAYAATRPQGSADLAITVERSAGAVPFQIERHSEGRETQLDIIVWSRIDLGRTTRASALEIDEIIRALLDGLHGPADGVEICDIQTDEATQQDDTPNDDSDSWTCSYTRPTVIFWKGLVTDHRRALIATPP